MITRKEMTRMLLKEGLLSCLENHSFESLTVTLLCKASGITRSTFYLHYSNIMEIVDDLVDDATCHKYETLYSGKCTYQTIEGANHNFASASARKELNESILTFLQALK